MRFTNVFSGRPSFYDRTPLDVQKSTSLQVAPHAQTQRWIYTVPSARKAQITLLENWVNRITVATTASQVTMFIKNTPSGGSTLVVSEATFFGNNIDSRTQHTRGNTAILLAGDAIESDDSDASTAGTAHLGANLMATEFDA